MQNFEKVIALYEYTKKLVELKYKVESDIKNQLFSLSLNDIPQYEKFIEYSFRDFIKTEDEGLAEAELPPLLRVQKPDFQNCPKPSELLLPWLIDGWSNYKNDVKHKIERKIGEGNFPDKIELAVPKSRTVEFSQTELELWSNENLNNPNLKDKQEEIDV